MTEKVVLRWKYQVVIHRRNKRLHRLIDIVGIVWNHALAQQSRYHRLTGGYIGKYTMSSHLLKLRRRSPRCQYWQQLNSQAIKDICDRQDKGYQRFFDKIAKRPPKFRKVKRYRSIALPIGNGCQLMESDNPRIGKLRLAFGWRGAETMTVKYHIGDRTVSGQGEIRHHHAYRRWQVLAFVCGRAGAASDSLSQHGQNRRV